MGRITRMDYRNGPSYTRYKKLYLTSVIVKQLTLAIYGFKYFLCSLLGQSSLELPQKVISPRNMQFMYRKMDRIPWDGTSHAWVTVAVAQLLIQLFY